MNTMTCTTMRDAAGEMALELLDGEDRAAALAHLETCPSCRREVALLAEAVDELLALAPEVEPSHGFEQRVLASIAGIAGAAPPKGPEPARPVPIPRRFSRRHSLIAAAAVLVTLIVAAGVFVGTRSTSPEGPSQIAAMRSAAGQTVGQVELVADPASLVVTVNDWVGLVHGYGATVDAPYWLAVQTGDGSRHLYRVPSVDQHPWSIDLDTPASTVVTVSMVDNHGTVWCTAQFAP